MRTDLLLPSQAELPQGWYLAQLGDVTQIAPGVQVSELAEDDLVHFVPMAAVAENFFGMDIKQQRPFDEVRKGYTAFIEGDVLFAKITPCMENGKGGIVPALPNRVAYGSTEFHVLRPSPAISSNWLAHFLSQPQFRKLARANMTGTAGQMRVPTKWLQTVGLPVPPKAEQTRIVEKLEELLSDLDAGVAELKAAQKKLAQYRQSLLKAAVEGALTAEWRAKQTPLSPCGRGTGGEGAHTPATLDDVWLQARARELRKQQTAEEHALWQQLRAKRFSGWKFRRQQPLGRFIVDFVCFAQRLIVELDGGQHARAAEYDKHRDNWLKQQGFRVLRFWNNEWSERQEAVLEAIWQALQHKPPLPNPSPTRGEGLGNADAPAPLSPRGRGAGGEGETFETGAQLLERILSERRARWEAKQLAKFKEQGKTPPKDWQRKYPEPVPPDTTDLPELPEGWVWASLDQCSLDESAITDGPFGSNLKSSHYQDVGPRVIRLQNVGDGVFLDAKAHISRVHYDELAKHAVEDNDLVVAMLGEGLPKACLIPKGVSPAIVKADCARVRLNASLALPRLVMFQVNSKPARDFVLTFVKDVGRPRINLRHIRAIPLAICPMEEQLEMERGLIDAHSVINEQLEAVELALKQSAAQRQNLLRAAFAGQLVPQDPNDEPASVLLARIRAERLVRASSRNNKYSAALAGRKPKC